MMQKNLYVLTGVPGTGKSTFIREKLVPTLSESTKVMSRDVVRFSMLDEKDKYFANEKEVWKEFISQIKSSLEVNENTIVDATHINKVSRTKLFNALSPIPTEINIISVVILNDLETCLNRNKQRTGRAFVPEGAIKKMYDAFEMPSSLEGFQDIRIYKNN